MGRKVESVRENSHVLLYNRYFYCDYWYLRSLELIQSQLAGMGSAPVQGYRVYRFCVGEKHAALHSVPHTTPRSLLRPCGDFDATRPSDSRFERSQNVLLH